MCELCAWNSGHLRPGFYFRFSWLSAGFQAESRHFSVSGWEKLWWRLFIGPRAIVCSSSGSLSLLSWQLKWPARMPGCLDALMSECLTAWLPFPLAFPFPCPACRVNKNSVKRSRHRLKDYYCYFMTVYVFFLLCVCPSASDNADLKGYIHRNIG